VTTHGGVRKKLGSDKLKAWKREVDTDRPRRKSSSITYLNVEHSLPYGRLTRLTEDVLGFAISEGTVANKLKAILIQAKGIIQRIKAHVIAAAWTGSDETGTHVRGKKFWQWVWQSPEASYYVVDK
jgi:hypothetical protein